MTSSKSACLARFAVVILINSTLHGAPPTEITVVATGVGESPEQAKKELILDGLRKASSTYVMSKEVVNNEDISSKLATFSEGIVKTTEITSQPQKDSQGLFKTTGKVTVVRKNLIDALRESKVTLNGAVRSDELLARAVSLKNLKTESNNIIEMILDDDPRRYDARLAGSLSLVPVQSLSEAEARESMSWVTASVVVTPNLRLYREEVLPKLITVLEAITEKAARHSVKFDNPHLIDGYVWPKLADKAGLDRAMEQHFAGVSFAGLIQNWAPAKDRAHISQELFLGADMMFGAKANALPVFTSGAKWYMSSCSRPFAAYNVSLVVPDINNNLELRSFSVAPAFFLPFSDLLKSRKLAIPANRTQGIGTVNPHFPALRSGYRLFQRPSPGKQFPSNQIFRPFGPLSPATPISPPSGPVTASFNGLHRESNFLAIMRRADTYKNDPEEAILPEANRTQSSHADAQIEAALPTMKDRGAIMDSQNIARSLAYIHCWFEGDPRSPLMWTRYGDNNRGICIGSSSRALQAAWTSPPSHLHCNLGRCTYWDEGRALPEMVSSFPAFRKRPKYRDEQEIRILARIKLDRTPVDADGYIVLPPVYEALPVDLAVLMQTVILGASLDGVAKERILDVLGQLMPEERILTQDPLGDSTH